MKSPGFSTNLKFQFRVVAHSQGKIIILADISVDVALSDVERAADRNVEVS